MLSTGSLTGMDAEMVTTHLSQGMSDILNAGLRNRTRLQPFLDFAAGKGVNLIGSGGVADLSGFIRQQESIMPLLELVRDFSGGDLNKVRSVFGSQYGSTLFGNLLGSQYSKLQANIAGITDSAGTVQTAYDRAMSGLINRTKQLGSTFMRLKIIIGESLLDPASSAVSILNRLGLGAEFLAQRLGGLLDPLLRFGAVTSIFTVVTGLFVAASSGLGILSSQLALSAVQGGALGKILGGSLSKAIWRVTWLSGGLIAAQELLALGWRRDFLGLRSVTLGWWQTTSSIFGGVSELFRNLDWSTGMTEMSDSTRQALSAMGIYDFTITLSMALYRAGTFLRSFGTAFRETFTAYGELLRGATEGTLHFLRAANVLPRVQRWLENLLTPTQDNVQAWSSFGSVLGRVAALGTAVGVVGALAVSTTLLGRAAWFAVGGARGLLIAASPLLAIFGALAATGILFKSVFDKNLFGFADGLRERAPHLAAFLTDLRRNLSELVNVYRRDGLGKALSELTFSLSGLYPSQVWANTRNRLTRLATAISSFPHDANSRGLATAFRSALGTVFGVDATTAVYARVADFRTRLGTELADIRQQVLRFGADVRAQGLRAALGNSQIGGNLAASWNAALTTISQRTDAFMAAHGWTSYWQEARAKFGDYTQMMLGRWQQVTGGFKSAWVDLKAKVNFGEFWRAGMDMLTIATTLGAAAWSTFTTTVGAAWDALMNRVDWSAISHLVGSVSTSLNSLDKNGNVSKLFGWLARTSFNALADGMNIVVSSLQTAHDLLAATGKVLSGQDFSGFPTFAASFGRLWTQLNEQPLGLAVAAGSMLILRCRFSGLFGIVGKVLNIFGRVGGFLLDFARVTIMRVAVPALVTAGRVLLAAFALNPIGATITAIGALIFGGIAAWQNDFLGFKTFTTNLWSGMRDKFIAAWQSIFTWWSTTGKAKFQEMTSGLGRFLGRGFMLDNSTFDPLAIATQSGFAVQPTTQPTTPPIVKDYSPPPAPRLGLRLPSGQPPVIPRLTLRTPQFDAEPRVQVQGEMSPQLRAALENRTRNLAADARGEHSRGGVTTTSAEIAAMRAELQQILAELKKGNAIDRTTIIKLDNKVLAKGTDRARAGRQQLGGQ